MMRMNFEPIAAASSMLRDSTQMMGNNFAMLQTMLQMRYSEEAARAEQEEKTRRSEAVWGRLDKYFAFGSQAAGKQLGGYLKRKMGGDATPPAAKQTEDSESEDSDEDEEDAPENLIALICQDFGKTLSNEQRKSMREKLSDETLSLFDELFCAKTDDEAIELFMLIKDKVGQDEIMELIGILDASQIDCYELMLKEVELRTTDEADEEEPDT